MTRLLSLAAGVHPTLPPARMAEVAAAAGWPACGIWFDGATWTDATTREVKKRLEQVNAELVGAPGAPALSLANDGSKPIRANLTDVKESILIGIVLTPALVALATFTAPARAGGELNLFGWSEYIPQTVLDGFTKETGIAVDLRNGESSQLAGQIGEEGANSPADIFYSEQCPPIAYVAEKGLLEKIDASTLQQIPAAYAAKDGTWIGATIRGRVIAYNKKLVQPSALPKSILDLKSPEYKGKFAYAIRDGFQEQIMAILVLKGRKEALDWLRGVKANGVLYSGNRSGEIECAGILCRQAPGRPKLGHAITCAAGDLQAPVGQHLQIEAQKLRAVTVYCGGTQAVQECRDLCCIQRDRRIF